jgi:cytochrome P450
MTTNPIDLSSAEFLANPYPVYEQLREAQAPTWLPHGGPTGGMWLFTRYEDVAEILKEARTSKDLSRLLPPEKLSPLDHAMLSKDPPDHTRLRSLANQAFTPNRVRDLEPRILYIADELIYRVRSSGQMDFMADFALPLPVIVIADLLGVPPEDRETFRSWSNQIVTGVDAVRASQQNAQKQEEALMALAGYFTHLIRQRREQPRQDLISAMIQARDAQDRLSEEELLGTCILLLIAGHETTVNLLGNGLLTLLHHPDQLALLRRHPEEMPSAVEEMLRFESPVQRATFRVTTSAIEIGGQTLEKDSRSAQ